MLSVVAMSVVLTDMFATRFEWDEARKGQQEEREALGLKPKSKNFDLREEYFVRRPSLLCNLDSMAQKLSMQAEENWNEWENKRVPRLPGQAEWGDAGEGYREVPGSRWQTGMKPAPPPEVKL